MGNNRSSLFHPPLKTGGGTTLWNHIDTIYQILSDNDVGRWVTFTALANSGVKTITHGFGVAFDDLKILVYTGSYPDMTQSTAFTVTVNAANPKTKIDITAPSSGGPFSGAVLVLHTAAWQQRVVTTAQRTSLVSPKPGSFVYDSDVGSLFVYKDSAWVAVADVSSAQTLTNKIISGITNTITDISLTTGVTGVLPASKGGTGVSNADAATLTRSGGHGLTLTTTATTSVTLPTTGTLSTLAGAEVLTNKDIDGGTASNTRRTTLPKASKTILDGLTRKQATLVYGEDTNKVYADDGSTLKEIGSGSSGINYLSAHFAADALGAVELSVGDTLTTTTRTSPTQWGSSDATALIAQSTNSTLRGTTNYLVSFTTNAQFVESPLFTIDGSDLAKPLTVTFDVSGVATSDDVQVYVARYNASNVLQERIVIAGTASATSPNSARVPTGTTSFKGFFIPSATATDKYAIRWRRNANNTSLRLDSIFVGPQSLATGAIVTDWQSYTPTFSNLVGGANTSFKYRRVGSNVEINGHFQTTTASPSTSTLAIGLPSGLTIDSNAISDFALLNQYGTVSLYLFSTGLTQTNKFSVALESGTGGTSAFVLTQAVGAARVRESDLGQNNYVEVSATIPISQWSSNVTMAERAVEEFASNSSATDADDTTSFANGASGSTGILQTTALTDLRKKRVRFNTPILATDTLHVEIFDGFSWVSPSRLITTDGNKFTVGDLRAGYNSSASTDTQGIGYRTVSATDVDVYFGRYLTTEASFTTGWNAGFSGFSAKWRVRKVSGGAAVGFPISPANITLINSADNYAGNTRLGLMQYLHGTTYNGGNSPTITLVGGGGTLSAVDGSSFIPYQMADGSWRMKFYFVVTVSSAGRTFANFAIAGITFPTIANYITIAGGPLAGFAPFYAAIVTNGSNVITCSHANNTTTNYSFSGDIPLSSKPTWAY